MRINNNNNNNNSPNHHVLSRQLKEKPRLGGLKYSLFGEIGDLQLA